jgi:hypothetical protein
MTKEDIIRMIREAGFRVISKPSKDRQLLILKTTHLHRFANLVAAEEREACAVIAFNARTYIEAAEAIRARGQDD